MSGVWACRAEVAWTENLARLNRDWLELHGIRQLDYNDDINKKEDDDIRADGDSHLVAADFDSFEVPHCRAAMAWRRTSCSLVAQLHRGQGAASAIVDDAGALLILGSSCMTYSCYRLVRAASRAAKPIAMINLDG